MTITEAELVKAYQGFAQSPNGEVILEDLRYRFRDIQLGDRASTALEAGIAIGKHDAVQYIESMIEERTGG